MREKGKNERKGGKGKKRRKIEKKRGREMGLRG